MKNKILHHDMKREDDWFYLCRSDYKAIDADKVAVHVKDVTCLNCLRMLKQMAKRGELK